MPLNEEAISQQQELLAAYRHTLAHLLQQAAQYGGEVFAPPQTANGIAEARWQIRRIKAVLQENGVQVSDDPNDKLPRRRKSIQHVKTGDEVSSDKVAGDEVSGDKVMGDKTIIDTGGGDYAEGDITNQEGILNVGVNQGAININYLPPTTAKLSPQQRRNRSHLLDKVESFWVKGFLEQSLAEVAHIELRMEQSLDAVPQHWESIVQQSTQPNQPIKAGEPIIKVFDKLGGELLILGAPGAGKTILLLKLTHDLIVRARQNERHPIPVVFNLSSWAIRRQRLDSWLSEELNQRYNVPKKLASKWVISDEILPLLDGLDEVVEAYRDACVDTINNYRQERGFSPIAVCSRADEYNILIEKLQLEGAIVIQPLAKEHIDTYLKPRPLAGVRALLRDDPLLQELLTTPLMLNIVLLAYGKQSPKKLRASRTLEQRREQLFNDYIEEMFKRKHKPTQFTKEETIKWLRWLTNQMVQHNQTIFYIDQMQPDWLPLHEQEEYIK